MNELFGTLPDGTPVNSVGAVYDDLIAARAGAVAGYVCDAAFWDVGTIADAQHDHMFIVRTDGSGTQVIRAGYPPR